MADLVVTGSLYVSGILYMTGGANSVIDPPKKTEADILLMITGWGEAEESRTWYNLTTHQAEMWNGTRRVILG